MLDRLFTEKLLGPRDLEPSHDGLEVVGVFNPGAVAFGDGIALLVRVVEAPIEKREGYIAIPEWTDDGFSIEWFDEKDDTLGDPRKVVSKTSRTRLRFISHLRLYHLDSTGRRVVGEGLRMTPTNAFDSFGVEDPRITQIGDTYYITYVAVSIHGVCTCLASTRDFKKVDHHGVMFVPENKDVLLFPEKIGGRYVAMHRPNPRQSFSPPEMWIAESDDLIQWGRHRPLNCGFQGWELGRSGGGAPPVRTDRGWLEFYHGAEQPRQKGDVGVYRGALLLLDANNPSEVIARSEGPIFEPQYAWEKEGYVNQVVFPTALIPRGDDEMLVYYGAADTYTGVTAFSRKAMMDSLISRDAGVLASESSVPPVIG